MRSRTKLQSLCTKVTSGGTPSRSRPEYYATDDIGHLWVKSKELLDCAIEDTEEKISDSGLQESSAKYLPANTVLIAMYGANVGQLGWLRRPATVNQAICGLVVDPEVADHRYVFYALMHTRDGLIAQAQGAAQQNLNQDKIKSFEVPCPSLDEQRRIASILSAYDDLIANNTRRIVILEEMARRIYEEWFVRFRFPGHDALRAEQGLPSEWTTVPLGAVTTKIGSGATPRGGKSAYHQVGVPLIRSQNVYDNRFDDEGLAFLDADQAESLEGVTVGPEDVLINITGASVARCCMAPRRYVPARVNQHVMIIRADKAKIPPLYLLCVINSERRKRELLAYAQSGATREALTKDRMSQFEMVIPSREVLFAFEGTVGAMFQQREVLAEQTSVLKSTRDLLLPKLISGELDVSAMPEPEALAA